MRCPLAADVTRDAGGGRGVPARGRVAGRPARRAAAAGVGRGAAVRRGRRAGVRVRRARAHRHHRRHARVSCRHLALLPGWQDYDSEKNEKHFRWFILYLNTGPDITKEI